MATHNVTDQPTLTQGQQRALFLYLLDLFSISASLPACAYNAPLICIPPDGTKPGLLWQSPCNHWDCPRCGQMLARSHYGRMVEGARTLAETLPLYMLTVTLPGTISLADGETEYLERTHRLHANIDYRKRRDALNWHYAAVTERQTRGHPHSHYMTTFCPTDAYFIIDHYDQYRADIALLNAEIPAEMRYSPEPVEDIDLRQMFSPWLARACVQAGLGVQCRIALADVVEGASRYIAKYLFETTAFEIWPKKWRRVRYSQNWPKLPEYPSHGAFPVIRTADWLRLKKLRGTIMTNDFTILKRAHIRDCTNVKMKSG